MLNIFYMCLILADLSAPGLENTEALKESHKNRQVTH